MEDFFNSSQPLQQVKTVSQITAEIKNHLENRFFNLSVSGEISNFRPSAAGHCYFTLKDSRANLSAVLFAGKRRGLTFEPKDGQQVVATGNLSVYEPRGSYQLVCSTLQLSGEGQILAMLEQRKKQLALEGLFDSNRKKEIPLFPKTIAAITSPTGAAIRDIINVLSRRNNGIHLKIFPAVVQGAESAKQLVQRIEQVNRWKCADVIIMGRGGGSIEDLLPFSDEAVVRAVAQSEIPVISAVGHEIDRALSDFAADLRAPTPSAAAELVTQELSSLLNQLNVIQTACSHAMYQQIGMARNRLLPLLPNEMKRLLFNRFNEKRMEVSSLEENLFHSIEKKQNEYKHRLEILTRSLQDNSPLHFTQRGLARITTTANKGIRSVSQLKTGETIKIEMADGSAHTTVKEIFND